MFIELIILPKITKWGYMCTASHVRRVFFSEQSRIRMNISVGGLK